MTLPSIPLPLLGNTQPMYLGVPGSMQRLARLPDYGYSIGVSRGEATHTLISGGTAITRVPKTKRQWVLPFSGLTEDSANTLLAFYAGAFGLGPFVLVDPAWRNKLDPNVSSGGAVLQAISAWALAVTGTQTLTWDGTDAAQFPQSDVMAWTGAGNTSKFGFGNWSGATLVPRTAEAPVYLSDQPSSFAIYVRTASSTASVSVRMDGVTAAGAVSLSGSTQSGTAISTGWTRLESFLASGNTSAQYMIPTITCNTASAPVIWFCCADVQYGVTQSPNTIQPWVLGLGSPRVVVVPSSGGGFAVPTTLLPYRNHSLALAEI